MNLCEYAENLRSLGGILTALGGQYYRLLDDVGLELYDPERLMELRWATSTIPQGGRVEVKAEKWFTTSAHVYIFDFMDVGFGHTIRIYNVRKVS